MVVLNHFFFLWSFYLDVRSIIISSIHKNSHAHFIYEWDTLLLWKCNMTYCSTFILYSPPPDSSLGVPAGRIPWPLFVRPGLVHHFPLKCCPTNLSGCQASPISWKSGFVRKKKKKKGGGRQSCYHLCPYLLQPILRKKGSYFCLGILKGFQQWSLSDPHTTLFMIGLVAKNKNKV